MVKLRIYPEHRKLKLNSPPVAPDSSRPKLQLSRPHHGRRDCPIEAWALGLMAAQNPTLSTAEKSTRHQRAHSHTQMSPRRNTPSTSVQNRRHAHPRCASARARGAPAHAQLALVEPRGRHGAARASAYDTAGNLKIAARKAPFCGQSEPSPQHLSFTPLPSPQLSPSRPPLCARCDHHRQPNVITHPALRRRGPGNRYVRPARGAPPVPLSTHPVRPTMLTPPIRTPLSPPRHCAIAPLLPPRLAPPALPSECAPRRAKARLFQFRLRQLISLASPRCSVPSYRASVHFPPCAVARFEITVLTPARPARLHSDLTFKPTTSRSCLLPPASLQVAPLLQQLALGFIHSFICLLGAASSRSVDLSWLTNLARSILIRRTRVQSMRPDHVLTTQLKSEVRRKSDDTAALRARDGSRGTGTERHAHACDAWLSRRAHEQRPGGNPRSPEVMPRSVEAAAGRQRESNDISFWMLSPISRTCNICVRDLINSLDSDPRSMSLATGNESAVTIPRQAASRCWNLALAAGLNFFVSGSRTNCMVMTATYALCLGARLENPLVEYAAWILCLSPARIRQQEYRRGASEKSTGLGWINIKESVWWEPRQLLGLDLDWQLPRRHLQRNSVSPEDPIKKRGGIALLNRGKDTAARQSSSLSKVLASGNSSVEKNETARNRPGAQCEKWEVMARERSTVLLGVLRACQRIRARSAKCQKIATGRTVEPQVRGNRHLTVEGIYIRALKEVALVRAFLKAHLRKAGFGLGHRTAEKNQPKIYIEAAAGCHGAAATKYEDLRVSSMRAGAKSKPNLLETDKLSNKNSNPKASVPEYAIDPCIEYWTSNGEGEPVSEIQELQKRDAANSEKNMFRFRNQPH
ncbi:hypothetical protein FB451DRAFT_1527727 [Mycena latifolia]|nr:hypothetical protein FB451DRAFT_1527727 [Mycena latifolia]